jgi:hypothetical protein
MKTEYRMWNLTIDGVKNIQEPITISFLDDTISTKKDFSVKGSNVKAIYGLNGSGKTAIVTAVKILSSLLRNKDYLIERKDVLPNLINFHKKALNISTVFGRIDDGKVARVYRYSISLAVDSSVSISKEILEKLSDRTVNGQWKTLYSITDGTIRNDVESVSPEIVAKTTNLLRTSSLPSLLDLFKEKPAGDYASTGGLVDCRRFAQSIDVFLGNSDLHDGLLDLSMLKNPEISSERKEEVGQHRKDRVCRYHLSQVCEAFEHSLRVNREFHMFDEFVLVKGKDYLKRALRSSYKLRIAIVSLDNSSATSFPGRHSFLTASQTAWKSFSVMEIFRSIPKSIK